MDRKQIVVQRSRELFGDRIDDVSRMIYQDQEALRGWEEPAHLRAVVRREIRESAAVTGPTEEVSVAQLELSESCRSAAEPDRGGQREAMGHLLEAAARGLEKVARETTTDLMGEELLGLECALLIYARPALLVRDGCLASVPAFWNELERRRQDIELVQRGVGRIELLGHPEYDWVGTGFLVSDTCLMTTRRAAELFAESSGSGQWQFRPGVTAWLDYRSEYGQVPRPAYQVGTVLGIHECYDLALLEVDPPHDGDGIPTPLAIASQAPPTLERRPIYMVGYPVRDARRNEPEPIARIFRDVYNVKRVQPGAIRNVLSFRDVHLLQHDCGMLGNSGGSCIVDLETQQVLGMHVAGRYLETCTAIPLWMLRDDPMLRRHDVCFAEARSEDLRQITGQIERLARSGLWGETRTAIAGLYQRAFGSSSQPTG